MAGVLLLAAVSPELPHVSVDLVVSVIAMLLAVYGILLAARHDKKMGQQVREMADIAASIPTRATASFAEHLTCIGALIKKADHGEFKILTDCADYGSFFDPKSHARVFEGIVGARGRGVDVQILVGGPLRHITGSSEFADQEFDQLRKTRRFKLRLDVYLEYLRAETDREFERWLADRAEDASKRGEFRRWLLDNEAKGPAALGLEAGDEALARNLVACRSVFAHRRATLSVGQGAIFQTLLWGREKFFEERLLERAGVRVQRRTSLRPTIFFWLRDDADAPEAAFMFAQSDRETPGSAMMTVDPNFLGFFRATFDGAQTGGQP